jgi:hypothetical protein
MTLARPSSCKEEDRGALAPKIFYALAQAATHLDRKNKEGKLPAGTEAPTGVESIRALIARPPPPTSFQRPVPRG